MLKRFIRWILPLVALLLIAMYLVLSPVLATHAAAPATHSHLVAPVIHPHVPASELPDWSWRS